MDWRLYYGTLRFSLGGDPVVGFAEREKILGMLGVSAGCIHPEHGRCNRLFRHVCSSEFGIVYPYWFFLRYKKLGAQGIEPRQRIAGQESHDPDGLPLLKKAMWVSHKACQTYPL